MADPKLFRLHYKSDCWRSLGYDSADKAQHQLAEIRSKRLDITRAVLVRQRWNRCEIIGEFTRKRL